MAKSAQPVARVIAQALELRIAQGMHTEALPLRQAELAEEFGTSHIPVREALATLAEKGLVQILPNRGAVIVPLTALQCRELADMRVALEVLAVRQAVPNLDEAHIEAARQALETGQNTQALEQRAQHNWAFHRSLYEPANRPFLMAQLDTLWRHADRYLQFAWSRAHYENKSDSEHAGILAACAARDVRLAARLTREHILEAAESVERLLSGA